MLDVPALKGAKSKMAELLRVEHLKKYFSTPAGLLHAVDDVSFTINQGETLGVVGESGCGKSTLGRVVLKLIDQTDGSIYFDGRDISKISKKENRELRKDPELITVPGIFVDALVQSEDTYGC